MTANINLNRYAASIRDVPMPARIARLPIAPNGMPVPWFVAFINGEPDFRVIDTPKLAIAVMANRCWLCGEQLGKYLAFTIGPMCAVNRVSSEPPSHRECAEYAVRTCPFLSRPRMRRNEKGIPEELKETVPGIGFTRNPGVVLIWITKSYKPFRPHMGGKGTLFSLGAPLQTLWFSEGRAATSAEIMHAIETGLPALQKLAAAEGPEAEAELNKQLTEAMTLVPA
jgi:hypothetical protein